MIYLDNAAGTRPYPEVIDIITDVLTKHWGNASSNTSFGHEAMTIIDKVTQQVADDINCNPEDIIWTSGACEANSLALQGFAYCYPTHFFTSKMEHTSINEIVKVASIINKAEFIKNDKNGFISLTDLDSRLLMDVNQWDTSLVSISFANSEFGTIQDIKAISKIVHSHGGYLHVDATQMYPWNKIDVQDLGIDMMSVSGQKMNCVKGVGFLYVKNGIDIATLIYGSQQEGRRGGTYPTHLIAAFGKALELTRQYDKYQNDNTVEHLRNRLLIALQKIEGTHLNGPGVDKRLPNNISLTIDGVRADTLVTMCDLMGIIIAKGSACKSYESVPSEALMAIGLTKEQALNTIRISLGRDNTEQEIDTAADIITKLVDRIRNDEE